MEIRPDVLCGSWESPHCHSILWDKVSYTSRGERSDVITTAFRHSCDEEAVDEIAGRKARTHGME